MKNKFIVLIFLFFNQLAHGHGPKLIVQLVVDQLRGDLIQQHQSQFGKDGFNYLLSHGINFYNAHHPHANTTTCAGHTTIATGSYPSLHGIVNNDWFDNKTKTLVYCVADKQSSPLPTLHTKISTEGCSAKNIMASTLSDELVLARKGRAFGVSLKDRSAISLAGHAGKAFWFDKTNGGFITTSYYYAQYPQWVNEWNKEYQFKPFIWELSAPKASYLNSDTPIVPQADSPFGQSFPHQVKAKAQDQYLNFLVRTPKADQLTADFAEHLLKAERLGKTTHKTDYLGISFSAVDVIGHQFGPNSLEAEDNLLVLDKTLAHLLKVIDEEVGLEHTLIVLTADHGVDNSPTYLQQHHLKEIAPMNVLHAQRQVVEMLRARYKLPKETLMHILPPYVYLDHKIINQHQLNSTEIKQSVAELLNNQAGVFRAYPLPVTGFEADWLTTKVNRMAYKGRAGDIYLVPPPYQSNGIKAEHRITHGSPWQYDSYVPLLFVNKQFKAQAIARPVWTTDIAATLAAVLMIKFPSAAVGTPLDEVLAAMNNSKGNLL